MHDTIVLILFFATVIGMWIWLSGRMKRNGRGWFLRHLAGASAGMFAGTMIVSIALAIGFIETKSHQQVAKVESASTQQEAPAKEAVEPQPVAQESSPPVETTSVTTQKTLGLTYQSYAKRLNKVLASLDKKYKVTGAVFSEGAVNDTWQAKLGEFVAVVASVSKENGEVLEVVAIGGGDGTPASGLEVMVMASAALTAATSDVEFREVFQGLPAMVKGQDRSYGNVKLSVNATKEVGNWFIASPI